MGLVKDNVHVLSCRIHEEMVSMISKEGLFFPFVRQLNSNDCGPACLKMVAKYYGREFSLDRLRRKSGANKNGVDLLGLSETAENFGFRSYGIAVSMEELTHKIQLPAILHWDQNHFVVLYKIKKKYMWIADPGYGRMRLSKKEFLDHWSGDGESDTSKGIILDLYPTSQFYARNSEETKQFSVWKLFRTYLRKYKRYFYQIALGMLISSLLTLLAPFLTQALIDQGVNKQNMHFVYMILIAQIFVFLGGLSVEIVRSWILLHIGTRINVSLIADFLLKLFRLPLSFFDTKVLGDILQKIQDHHRVEDLLTTTTLSTLFSLWNILVFGIVLLLYDVVIFAVYFVLSASAIGWTLIFLKWRKRLDYKRFEQLSANQSKLIQMLQGVEDIKLNNSESQKRWEWEVIQSRLFRISVSALSLSQMQGIGAGALNQLKNILVTILAAAAVINGQITLGAMMAISMVIGQLNAPLAQMRGIIHRFQDAMIGVNRIREIHVMEDETAYEKPGWTLNSSSQSLRLEQIWFSYNGIAGEPILQDVSYRIPMGKVTALVGTSGSGKTTLIKLLLKYYQPTQGKIILGDTDLQTIPHYDWRTRCGTVLQEGYIFSDTVLENIGLGSTVIDREKVRWAAQVASIDSFIEKELPLGYDTKIGEEGLQLSVGQKQRVLIARAVYREPEFLFLDEATNSLDALNESQIMDRLVSFFRGRTVVLVAHRLSSVQKADNILVLDKGKIVESGRHIDLVKKQGHYFHLIKDQLNIG